MFVGAGDAAMAPPDFVADQLTLSKPGGHIMPNLLLLETHRPSYGPELLQYMNHVYAVKFIYSGKATKFCEIFTLLLSYVG